MAAQILYRSLGPNYDPLFGQSQANFLSDIYAVSQAIQTTLLLLFGEWWENTNAGTPLFQSVLGSATTAQAIGLVIRQRILSVPFVTGITAMNVTYNPPRQFNFVANVQTSFGPLTVSTQPLQS
jgi:hypothetical protein